MHNFNAINLSQLLLYLQCRGREIFRSLYSEAALIEKWAKPISRENIRINYFMTKMMHRMVVSAGRTLLFTESFRKQHSEKFWSQDH